MQRMLKIFSCSLSSFKRMLPFSRVLHSLYTGMQRIQETRFVLFINTLCWFKLSNLWFIAKCRVCRLLFVDNNSRGVHLRMHLKEGTVKEKPKWMSRGLYFDSISGSEFTSAVTCKACDKQFPAKKARTGSERLIGSIDFYIHCIEECIAFKDKGNESCSSSIYILI